MRVLRFLRFVVPYAISGKWRGSFVPFRQVVANYWVYASLPEKDWDA